VQTAYRELPLTKRRKTLFLALFVGWHILATLVWGGGPKTREMAAPVLWPYCALFRAAHSWGMFATVDQERAVRATLIGPGGESQVLAPPEHAAFWRSFVENRERKLVSQLSQEHHRKAWGRNYLAKLCTGKAQSSKVILEVYDLKKRAFEQVDEVKCQGGPT